MSQIIRTVGIIMVGLMLTTSSVSAQTAGYQYQSNGIFGCSNIGGASISSGTFAAMGGTFVPVNDAAVTLNSGIMDYLQCVLRPLVSRLRESATASFTKKGLSGFLTGRNGNPMWPVDLNADIVAAGDKAALSQLMNINEVNPAFRNQVRSTVARQYMAETRTNNQLVCNYGGDLKADITNPTSRPFSFDDFHNFMNPACNPLGAASLVRNAVDRQVDTSVGQMLFKLQTGNGIYGVEQLDDNGNTITVTPGAMVASNANQLVQSGFSQLENATDIGQMISSLYAGVSTQVMTSAQGLKGLAQNNGGPSFLDAMTTASSNGVVGATGNAALGILTAARQNELKYLSAMNATAQNLTQTIGQLRAAETKCWDLITYQKDDHPERHVCVAPPVDSVCMGSTTPASDGSVSQEAPKEKIATSTLASQGVIDAQIAPLASTTIDNIHTSQTALARINTMISGIANAKTVAEQQASLQMLDQLVAQGALHTQYDAQNAAQKQSDTQNAMNTLLKDTVTAWGDNTDATVGWCNIKNPAVINRWSAAWKL